MQSRVIALAVMLTMAPAAWAQAARAEGAAADADAAMERAKRAAAGPLKAIQQASKIRRRPGEGEPAAPAATPATTTVLAASTTSAPAPAPAAAAPVPPPAPATERAEAPAVARVLEAEARVPTLATVAGIEAQTATPATTMMPAMAVSQPLLDTLPLQSKVLSMVEPNIPARLMEQGPRVAEVEAELMLRADGSVAEVMLLPPVPRAWQRYITTALEQWRFEPMAGPRQHRVRLVFGSAN